MWMCACGCVCKCTKAAYYSNALEVWRTAYPLRGLKKWLGEVDQQDTAEKQYSDIHDMHEDYVNNLPTMSFPLPFRILFPHREWWRKETRYRIVSSRHRLRWQKKPGKRKCNMKTERRYVAEKSKARVGKRIRCWYKKITGEIESERAGKWWNRTGKKEKRAEKGPKWMRRKRTYSIESV